MEMYHEMRMVFIWFIMFSLGSVRLQQLEPSPELDNRCFLNGGGSTLSFFVKESLPISSVVGRLDIQGDTNEDIDLILGKLYKTVTVKIYVINNLNMKFKFCKHSK